MCPTLNTPDHVVSDDLRNAAQEVVDAVRRNTPFPFLLDAKLGSAEEGPMMDAEAAAVSNTPLYTIPIKWKDIVRQLIEADAQYDNAFHEIARRAKAGESKERTFESTFVITLRKPRRKAKSVAPQSKKASSPAPTDKTRKRKPAKASRNGKTTTVQADNPKDTAFELVAQVPGQVKKVSKPRKRKAPPTPQQHGTAGSAGPPDQRRRKQGIAKGAAALTLSPTPNWLTDNAPPRCGAATGATLPRTSNRTP